jgi:Fe-S oxidoreductase
MGLIHRWAGVASWMPGLANFGARLPLTKWVAGIASQREMPRFARQTFRTWFRKRGPSKGTGERVMLWPDTFNNYFRPQTAIAATRVLESLGFDVVIPKRALCCGRPLYDWGRLDQAKALWRQTLDTMKDEIAAGTPVIGLEPACTSAFRDELVNLFPHHDLAQKLGRQTLFLTEFLAAHGDGLPQIGGEALVQMHCHHHAVLKPQAEQDVLKRLGVGFEVMASGCCGMAGAFGFEREKYDVSMTAAERVMLPKVRAAALDTPILANGFSCREQIEQGSHRPTRHIAELIAEHLG